MSVARRLIGSLVSVALLTAGALAVAPPAAGQDERDPVPPVIVRITTPDTAGTYTVDWQTLGGCDPGSGTSGMSGEITLTVEATESADDTPEPGELTGTPDFGVVVIRPICLYVWHVSLVEATTDANCIVGPAPFAPDDTNQIRITLDDPATSCTQRSRIVVRLHPTLPLAVDETDHNAILRTRFIATARRVEDAPRRCYTRTAISKVDDKDTADDPTDDTVSLELRVVATTAAGEECRYDVTLRVPRRLAATLGDQDHSVFENVEPGATLDFTVGVATKTIYLLQNVTGDSGGANARYELAPCGEPEESDLPPPLLPRPSGGGIQDGSSTTFVELREGPSTSPPRWPRIHRPPTHSTASACACWTARARPVRRSSRSTTCPTAALRRSRASLSTCPGPRSRRSWNSRSPVATRSNRRPTGRPATRATAGTPAEPNRPATTTSPTDARRASRGPSPPARRSDPGR